MTGTHPAIRRPQRGPSCPAPNTALACFLRAAFLSRYFPLREFGYDLDCSAHGSSDLWLAWTHQHKEWCSPRMRTLQSAFYRWVASGVSFPDIFFVADLENGGADTRARGHTYSQLHARTTRRSVLNIAGRQLAHRTNCSEQRWAL